jgi:hypothetical protein
MDKEEKEEVKEEMKDCCKGMHCHHHHHRGGGAGGGLYFFGLLGAAFYFLQHAVTSSDYVWGILKAIVWPALLIFKVFTMLKI